MHELSIAMSVTDGALEELSRHPGESAVAVHLQLGRLSGVVKEALLFSYQLACEGTALEGSQLVIKDIDVAVFCPRCNAGCEVASIQELKCSVCGTRSAEIVRGREILIVGLELENAYEAAAR